MFYIYSIENLITGKVYVGQHQAHVKPSLERYFGGGEYIKKSIEKYGKSNFKKTIIKENINCKSAANIFERLYIKKYNSLTPNGYNLTPGGDGGGKKTSEETKDKMRISHTGKRLSLDHKIKIGLGVNLAHKQNPDIRKRQSDSNKGEKNAFFGKQHTEEFKKNHSKLMQGREPWNKNKTKKKI